MKTRLLIKDVIYFGAVAEAYHMDSHKIAWSWTYPCGCKGNTELPYPHTYEICEHKDNLWWADRYKETGRTAYMPLQEDEVEEVLCEFSIGEQDAPKLRALIEEAIELLGEIGMEYHDIFTAKIKAEVGVDILSVLEEHSFYTQTKDWYLRNNITPIYFEEIKVNTVSKYMAERLLLQLEKAKTAHLDAKWFPAINQDQRLLFDEHVVKIEEPGHVTSEDGMIKAASD